MRNKFIKILLFIFLVVLTDIILGNILTVLFNRTQTGENGGTINFLLKKKVDLLILGSSRAVHNVDPKIIEKNFNISAFNAGANGQKLLYSIMVADLYLKENEPKYIILTMETDSLLFKEEELKYIQVLSPFINKSDYVREMLLLESPYEWLKYFSYTYRYNGKVLSILKNQFKKAPPGFNGYSGLSGKFQTAQNFQNETEEDIKNIDKIEKQFVNDSLAKRAFQYLLDLCKAKNIVLLIINTPTASSKYKITYSTWKNSLLKFITNYSFAHYIELNNYSNPELFTPNLFRDGAHLNAEGSKLYTEKLVEKLKNYCNKWK